MKILDKNLGKSFSPVVQIMPFVTALTFSNLAIAGSDIHENHRGHHHHDAVELSGLLSSHQHQAGEWMFGVSYEQREFSGNYYGSTQINSEVLSAAGFSMYASAMRMDMAMLHIMYAVSNKVTLVLMPHYMKMDMDMMPLADTMHGSMHNATASMTNSMMAHSAHGSMHNMSVSGWSDTVLGATVRLWDEAELLIQANLNVSAPTGSVQQKQGNGQFMPYGMQLGTGTWDALPGITVRQNIGTRLLMGGRLSTRLPLESKNESGFSVGEIYTVESWIGCSLKEAVALSVRLTYEKQHRISGHYNGPHNHASPTDFQRNYGGEFLDFGLGIHVNPRISALRLGLEWIVPVSEHYNGFQLGRDQGVSANVSWAW